MRILLTFSFCLCTSLLQSQPQYWQQQVNYKIDVKLDEVGKILRGTETVSYKNNSPDTLAFIWFHLYPNAYKHTATAFFKQFRDDPVSQVRTRRLARGYIDSLDFRVDDRPALISPHPNTDYIDIIKLNLPSALLPGDSAVIETTFKVQLPEFFSRSGYSKTQVMACQWFPKAAVYDKDGWHEFPYLQTGEFYSDFGNYDVNITVPSNFIVAATGTLRNEAESALYKKTGRINSLAKTFSEYVYPQWQTSASKTLRYQADSVIDFAWFADSDFIIQYDTVRFGSGKVIEAFSFFHYASRKLWNNSIHFVKDAAKKYSGWIGEYPYPLVQAVEGPSNESSGGMEYPMLTLITSTNATKERLDATIAHEVGHNWFMALLATNEREYPWMDEGFNTYFQFRYEAEKYQSNSLFKSMNLSVPGDPIVALQTLYTIISQMDIPMPVLSSSAAYKNSNDYAMTAYFKTALWLYLLELSVGRSELDAAFKNYFSQWKYRHPQPADFKKSFELTLGKKLDEYFILLQKEGSF